MREKKAIKSTKESFDVVDKMNEKHVIIDGMRRKVWKINEQRRDLKV